MSKFNTIALVVAAGVGKRFDGEIPKQYLLIDGKSILQIIVEKFLQHSQVDAVAVVINENHRDLYQKSTENLYLLPPILGGKERQDSARLGLLSIAKYEPEKVLIHDAARLFFTPQLINDLLVELDHYEGAIPVCPITDTIKQVDQDYVVQKTIPRGEIFSVQTPQVFKYKSILNAHQNSLKGGFTDDASLLEQQNIAVKSVITNNKNFKITTSEDFLLAKFLTGGRYVE
ncbi:MAG: 2-C-methyl-D-erythritol 4-phosphate cytidylyltransferase [Alphaproteobacteria bacterium]|jgi:2-C-methyl-D-erythritol 4-phosphate cytidylyltransferase/2-C-methyl-D-erythritol 2,4-cyclodiphosphate synthase